MSRAALILALGALLLGAQRGEAHLVPSGSDTLLGMMARADGMVVARSAAATHVRDAKAAATPFLAREVVAGNGPESAFVLDQEAPVLRYAELQDVLLLVARRGPDAGPQRWLSVQPAGAAIVLASPTLPDASRDVLQKLWLVAHPVPPGSADVVLAVGALIDTLSLPERKLRALAYLDLASLAADPEHFPASAIARLASYGDQPGDDEQLGSAIRELGRRLQQKDRAAVPPATAEGVQP